MAGVGKTELLKHLHNDLLQSQDSTHRLYWVPVSQNCSNERLHNLIAKSIGEDLSSEEDGLRRSVNVREEIKETALGRNGSPHITPGEDLANLSSEDDGLRRSVNVPEEITKAALGRNGSSHMPPGEDLASGLADQSNERLQNLIAKSIGVDLSSEDDGLRTSVNVPEEIKEATLGRNGSAHMPPSEDLAKLNKGCKMIVATRSKEVFLKMASPSIIKVDTLSHEEAVSLFMMKHGQDIELSPEKK
uniref:NB-ARC domain-containing protein n=1 Tax=Salix viminalis TaxID=40686 RepID=A0A6N2KXT6_SALVM